MSDRQQIRYTYDGAEEFQELNKAVHEYATLRAILDDHGLPRHHIALSRTIRVRRLGLRRGAFPLLAYRRELLFQFHQA
jgi:hypothetical protein